MVAHVDLVAFRATERNTGAVTIGGNAVTIGTNGTPLTADMLREGDTVLYDPATGRVLAIEHTGFPR